MELASHSDEHAPISTESGVWALAAGDDLSWAVVNMRAAERIVVDEALFSAFQAASSPHSIRAFKSDLQAFDLWCVSTEPRI